MGFCMFLQHFHCYTGKESLKRYKQEHFRVQHTFTLGKTRNESKNDLFQNASQGLISYSWPLREIPNSKQVPGGQLLMCFSLLPTGMQEDGPFLPLPAEVVPPATPAGSY